MQVWSRTLVALPHSFQCICVRFWERKRASKGVHRCACICTWIVFSTIQSRTSFLVVFA